MKLIEACESVTLEPLNHCLFTLAQVFYNNKTYVLLAAVVKTLVLRLCGLQQYNKIFVLCYCSCIVVVLHLCGLL